MQVNVMHVSLSMGSGGIENLIVSLASETNRDRFKLTVCCLDYGGELLDKLHASGIKSFVIGRKPGFDWRLIFRLARLFSGNNIHIVHTHNQAAHFYAGLAAKIARTPVLLTTEHSRHNTEGNSRRQLEKRILYRISDKWIVVSDEMAQQSIEQDGLPPDKLQVIKNGVDFAGYHLMDRSQDAALERLKRDLDLPGGCKIIIMVARLHPIKNHALFLRSFSDIYSADPTVHALLVGDGECRGSLEQLGKELGIDKNIHFLGYRDDVSNLLRISDIFVLCSKTEGLPLSLLEACAAQVPVLITRSANKAGLIEDGKNGTVVESDREHITLGLLNIIDNVEKATLMAEKSAMKIKSEYSLSAMARQYEKIYIELF